MLIWIVFIECGEFGDDNMKRNIVHRGVRFLLAKGVFNKLNDKSYLQLLYWSRLAKKLDLKNPKSFNEKLQWLKLNYRKDEFVKMVDKYEVREYVRKKIGDEYLVPLIGVYETFDDIKFDKLPEQFVIKCTHDSGGYVICDDKSKLDILRTRKKINELLKINYYYSGREWPYKNVKPRIIIEKYLSDDSDKELKDYRFFCFNGEPKFITVDFSITDKSKTRRNLYDLQWNLMDEEITYPRETSKAVARPEKLETLIQLSEKLAAGLPHVRIDFYSISGKIYFGEITFYHQTGMGIILPEEFNVKMGGWIALDNIK